MCDYVLRPGVLFIQGARNSALYDTNNQRLISLNNAATKQILKGNYNPEFLNQLVAEDLLCKSNTQSNVGRGEESFKIEKKLRFVWFEITTSKCNLFCKHCYIGDTTPSKKRILSFKEWQSLIKQAHELGAIKCQFIGGEPFLYKDGNKSLLDLVQYAKEIGFESIEIFSNLQILPEEAVQTLKDLNVKIATSVYAIDASIHDAITGVNGSLDKTLRNLFLLKSKGVKLRVAVILMKINEEFVEETVHYFRNLGISCRNPDPIRPEGRGDNVELIPSNQYLMKYSLMMSPQLMKIDMKTVCGSQQCHTCLDGKIVITESGDVFPCIFLREESFGNVRFDKLQNVVQKENLQEIWKMTKDDFLVCKDCEYRYACFDCRALANQVYKDTYKLGLAPNPWCTYNPYTGEWGKGFWRPVNGVLSYQPIVLKE